MHFNLLLGCKVKERKLVDEERARKGRKISSTMLLGFHSFLKKISTDLKITQKKCFSVSNMLTDNCLVQRIFPFTHKLFFTKKEKEFKD